MTIYPHNSPSSFHSPDLKTAETEEKGKRVFSYAPLTRTRSGGAHSPAFVPGDHLGALSRSRSGGNYATAMVRSDSLFRNTEYLDALTGGYSLTRTRSGDAVNKGRKILIASPPHCRAYQTFSSQLQSPAERRMPVLNVPYPSDRARSDGAPVEKAQIPLGHRSIIIQDRARSSGDGSKEHRIIIQSPSHAQSLEQLHPLTRSSSGVLRDDLHRRLNSCQISLRGQQFSIDALRDELFLMKAQVDDFLKSSEEKFKLAPQEGKADSQKSKLKTSDLVHELRAPLNGIGGYLDLLEMDLSPEEREEAINGLSESYRHLGEVLKNDITDSEELDLTLNQEKFTVKQIFQRVGSNTKMTDSDVKVELKFLGDEADFNTQMTGDFLKICKILINLTNNGIKYSQKPGTVFIQVRLLKKEDGKIDLRFYVRDHGPGMSNQFIQQNLFKKFSKGEKAEGSNQKASGLGLYLSQRFAEAMGSKIEVVSNQPRIVSDAAGREVSRTNIGTVFHFDGSFPIAVEKPQLQEQKTSGPLQGRRVLVIEDEKITQKQYKVFFSKAGAAEIRIEPNSVEALRIYQNEGPFDAVVSDQNVDGSYKGLEVAEQIQNIAERAGVVSPPFVLCSGEDLEGKVKELKEKGKIPPGLTVFTKPISFPGVIKTIKERLDNR